MSYRELIGQLKFLPIAAGAALSGGSVRRVAKSRPEHRRASRRLRRAVSTGPILAPSRAGSTPRLRFAS